MSHTIKELRETSDEQLIIDHDKKADSTDPGVNYYLDELQRRQQNRQTKIMLWLTVVITILTAANVITVFASLLCR
ncbi:MAG: hypothetical protein D4R45_00230 [Planctomycetaceae bacterium]|nr:MAG: hypothetical protein D4R45_00230 [Planctomycetaceae bacterium]